MPLIVPTLIGRSCNCDFITVITPLQAMKYAFAFGETGLKLRVFSLRDVEANFFAAYGNDPRSASSSTCDEETTRRVRCHRWWKLEITRTRFSKTQGVRGFSSLGVGETRRASSRMMKPSNDVRHVTRTRVFFFVVSVRMGKITSVRRHLMSAN